MVITAFAMQLTSSNISFSTIMNHWQVFGGPTCTM